MTKEQLSNNSLPPQVFITLAKAATILFARIVPASIAFVGMLFLVTGIWQLLRG